MNSRGDAADRHVPVLRDRIVDLLEPALQTPGAVCVDGTLGMGGHAEATRPARAAVSGGARRRNTRTTARPVREEPGADGLLSLIPS